MNLAYIPIILLLTSSYTYAQEKAVLIKEEVSSCHIFKNKLIHELNFEKTITLEKPFSTPLEIDEDIILNAILGTGRTFYIWSLFSKTYLAQGKIFYEEGLRNTMNSSDESKILIKLRTRNLFLNPSGIVMSILLFTFLSSSTLFRDIIKMPYISILSFAVLK